MASFSYRWVIQFSALRSMSSIDAGEMEYRLYSDSVMPATADGVGGVGVFVSIPDVEIGGRNAVD